MKLRYVLYAPLFDLRPYAIESWKFVFAAGTSPQALERGLEEAARPPTQKKKRRKPRGFKPK